MPNPRMPWRLLAVLAVGLLLISSLAAQAPPPTAGEAAQELTRGPLHEAFGQPTVFNPQPGPIAAKKPPELIDELPPDQKPEGENVAWIPGYWAWDDEDKNFIWVSGFWRSVPPGRTWVPGYWHTLNDGFQWVSGYWPSGRVAEVVEYLPPPPESLEAGPSIEAAAENQVWIPGCWVWQTTRYLWRPGFWTAANAEWVWVPAHFEWAPAGYVFVEGYWDYPLFNRGLLFAPVAFTALPDGFTYTPSIVIDVRFLAGALFTRPAYSHYYFGDYYDRAYTRAGIYPWFAFHNSRVGYDPLFAQTSYIYARRDPQWASRVRETFFQRQETAAARPPRTYRQFNEWVRKADPEGTQSIAFVRPLSEVPRTRDFPVRLERMDERRAQTVRAQATQVRKYREERMRVEQQAARDLPRAGTTTDPKVGTGPARTAPSRVKMPEAPRLGGTAPGVGGPGKGTGTPTGAGPRTAPPPDAPRVPDLAPPNSAPTTSPKGPGRALPHPEDNLRPPAGSGTAVPRGTGADPTPIPPTKKDRPEPPAGTSPPPKEPAAAVPPRKEPPAATPPKSAPPAVPPKSPPPKKDKDKD